MANSQGDKDRWAGVREWTNVAVAACALIVSVVSLWTTMQVSGVQDYLQSEIKRRNNDLNGIADRSRSLERVANERADRVVALQVATDGIFASSLDAQKRFLVAQGDLARVRFEVGDARANLANARSATAKVRSDMASQASAFDLFGRIKALEYASMHLTFKSLVDDDKPLSGSQTMSYIRELSAPDEQRMLQPYLDMIKIRTPAVCPRLANWTADLPPVAVPPPKPTISYMSNASKAEIARLTKIAQDRWSRDFAAYGEAQSVRLDKHLKASQTLHDLARSCMCSALATEKLSAKQICPS